MAMVAYGLMSCWTLLLVLPYLEMAPAVVCDCSLFGTEPHLISGWMFASGAIGVSLTALLLVGFGPLGAGTWPLTLFYGLFTLWRWWRHSRDGRKKLRAKALARIRDLGGRLVVQPVPA
jgi:hypothetical protein